MINTELALDKQLGVANVRLEFPWRFIEPEPGVYDWTRSDAIVAAANKAGVQLQPVLVWAPVWASTTPQGPVDGNTFQSFVSTIVNRYKGTIHFWEMWNEPNIANYWGGTEQQYVQDVLIPGFSAAHSADPRAKVILGGPTVADITWLDNIYRYGGGNSFDIMAFHDYGSSSQIASAAAAVQSVLDNHAQGSKPIWLGEYGAQTNTAAGEQQKQLMAGVLTGSMPIAMAQWYTLRDTYSVDCCPMSVAATGYWGLVQHDDVTIRQSYYFMQALLRKG